jgi:parallel beta-helix repeat protein/predicted outer membrane repeat protein
MGSLEQSECAPDSRERSERGPRPSLQTVLRWLAVGAVLLGVPAAANILHVPAQYYTIQHALIVASAGDTVLVAPGIYYEDIVWPDRPALHLLSEAGPEVTTIDAMSSGSVITMTAALDSTTVVRGFTITHGQAEEGGGIRCLHASPLIAGNHFVENTATWYGGGIYCAEGTCTPVIRDNLFRDNIVLDGSGGGVCAYAGAYPIIVGNEFSGNGATGYYGGGVHCEEGAALSYQIVIAGNSFYENSAWGGGGVSIWNPYARPPLIYDNTISGNTADTGGGLFFFWTLAVVSHNSICGNQASQGGAGIYAEESHQLIVQDCDISGNKAGSKGGGLAIAWLSSAPQILRNTINGNVASDGGGLYLYLDSSPTIRDNQIKGNQVSGSGGAIYCETRCAPAIESNFIVQNQATQAGGIYVDYSQPFISDCTIAGNGDIGLCFVNAWADHVPAVHDNAISGHAEYGLQNLNPSLIIPAERNWWGDPSGPFHPLLNPGGQGDPVSDYVSFVPWLTDPGGAATVPVSASSGVGLACRPNPFRGATTISCRLPDGAGAGDGVAATITIYDVAGRLLHASPVRWRPDGQASLTWDGRDRGGQPVPAGVQYVRLSADHESRTLKLVRLE